MNWFKSPRKREIPRWAIRLVISSTDHRFDPAGQSFGQGCESGNPGCLQPGCVCFKWWPASNLWGLWRGERGRPFDNCPAIEYFRCYPRSWGSSMRVSCAALFLVIAKFLTSSFVSQRLRVIVLLNRFAKHLISGITSSSSSTMWGQLKLLWELWIGVT